MNLKQLEAMRERVNSLVGATATMAGDSTPTAMNLVQEILANTMAGITSSDSVATVARIMTMRPAIINVAATMRIFDKTLSSPPTAAGNPDDRSMMHGESRVRLVDGVGSGQAEVVASADGTEIR